VDIRNDNIGLVKVGSIGRRAANLDRFWIRLAVQYAAFDVEHIGFGRIEISAELAGDGKPRSDDKCSGGFESKRGESDTARLAATDGQDDSDFPFLSVRFGGESSQLGIRFALWGAETGILRDIRLPGLERIILHVCFLARL
jgi:hypothetical protein